MAKLVLHIPGGGMRDIPLEGGRITLGRRADNHVWLPYPAVSADHAAVVTVLEDSFLEDLQSTNGTLVNGKRITKHFLRDHDAIDMGRVQLVYLADNDEMIAPLDPEAAGSGASNPDQPTVAVLPEGVTEGSADKPAPPTIDERELTPVDKMLADLMETNTDEVVAVDMPPALTVVEGRRGNTEREGRGEATSGVYVEVMNGPNAGQIAPMTKREFVLGHKGATKAVISREDERFVLVRVDLAADIRINSIPVLGERESLAFGDTIDVAGVLLRFGRRPPL